MRILVAVDESEHARRVVRYVGALLQRTPDVDVTLFHVLKPIPRELLEHGGSERPEVEAQLSEQLKHEQQAWIIGEQERECPILRNACRTLTQAGFDAGRVTLRFGHHDDIAANILEAAREGKYDTVAIGRQGTSGIRRLFGGGITDQLLRNSDGLALWVID